jgi:hypothetical protein
LLFLLDSQLFCNTFDIEKFEQIASKIDVMAPSVVEYYLSDLADSVDSQASLSYSSIQYKVDFQEYSLLLDYDENIYLEFVPSSDNDYETGALW